jgi:hypothetical protein
MNAAEWFWWALTICAIGWYMSVTIYVAIRGAFDIRRMLARLESQRSREDEAGT